MKESRICPRFVVEYANYKYRKLEANRLMDENAKAEILQKITRALRYLDTGIMTVDEAMKTIVEA